MTPTRPDIEITLELGTRRRSVPLVALAAAAGLSPRFLRDRLTEVLLRCPQGVDNQAVRLEGEPTEGEERFVSFISFHRSIEEKLERIVSVERGGAGERTIASGLVDRLAEELGDRHSLPYLRQLAEQYPPSLLNEALRRTLAVPRERIRGSRGGYFVGVLRRLAVARSVYARTSTTSS
jgi:hypothetical protein